MLAASLVSVAAAVPADSVATIRARRADTSCHSYNDHISILKLIERNWGLGPLTPRSRDRLPNPRADKDNPYVLVNSPAIGSQADELNQMIESKH